jgi:hypothetical protein
MDEKRYQPLRDLLSFLNQEDTEFEVIQFPHSEPERRSPRLQLAEFTPIVLRCQDGHRVSGKLRCISMTGGLVSAASPLPPGALVKLMFVTPKGPVAGMAEMLHPVSWTEQPFRFCAIPESDQQRLRAVIQPSRGQAG